MTGGSDEEELLRSVAQQNARSIFLARQRAEEELVRTKEELERKSDELARSVSMLRATLESTTDGILVTDDVGAVTGFNEKYVSLWQVPPEVMEVRTHARIMDMVSRQLGNPDEFLARTRAIYATSPPESYDLLELIDGRFIERFSTIQVVDERNVGRVWSFRDITERRRAEVDLRKHSEWLRVTLKSIGDGVVTTDIDGRVLSLNAVAQSLTGWTQEQAEGRPLAEVFRIVNEESRQPVENPAERALKEGRVVGLANHTILISRDGTETPIDDSAAPIRDEEDRIQGTVLIFRSIVERKQSEEALRQSGERLRLALDAGRMGTWDWDIPRERVAWSPGLEAIHGLAPGTFGGTFADYQDDIHPEDRDLVARSISDTIQNGTDFHVEYRLVWPDNTVHWVESRGKLYRDDSGTPVRMVGVCMDVEIRKRAEETARFLGDASAALAELTDYAGTLQRVAALAVPFFADWCTVDMLETDGSIRRLAVTHSDPGKVQLAHELFRRYPPQPSEPYGLMNVLRTGKSDWAAVISDSMLVESTTDREQLEIIRELGLKSYICAPLCARDRPIGALTFVTAESGRVYSEADLAAAEDLAHRAAIAIENANLLGVLRESDRRKDEFLAMLAHELRNPLAPIRNSVQILRGEASASDLAWATEVIDRQVHQMTRLVDDLLDVSRITKGRIELRRERVNLASVVGSAVEAGRPLIEKGGHTLAVILPPQPIHLDADPTRLAQVLSNLLNNAAKYMDPGGFIRLTAERRLDQAVIRVTDTGIGIPPEMLPHIFDMFAQVEVSLERSQGGLGIGLTLVKRLVELHGGTVEARSDGPNAGSEFIVRLPLAGAEVVLPEPSPKANNGFEVENGAEAASTTCRILVVDDNRDAADSLGALLRMLGHDIQTAHDGLEAVDAVSNFRPDVVLLDIGLPRLNGYDAARRIRELEDGRDIVLVALTGWGQDADRRRSREAGFDHHLTKPVEFADLQELLAAGKRRPSERASREI